MDTVRDRGPAHVPPSRTDAAAALGFPDTGWTPLNAWRIQALYGPIARALRALDSPATRLRVLQVGGHPAALTAMLNAGESPLAIDLLFVAPGDETLPAADASVDCAVAIDWLPSRAPSQRARAVAELGRVSRAAVVVVNAFEHSAARTASRAVNDLYRAVRGEDHPALGRPLEAGFPDKAAVRAGLEALFPIVAVCAIDDAASWQAAEALAVADPRTDRDPSNADIAAAAVYPPTASASDPDRAFRTMLVATRVATRAPLTSSTIASAPDAAIALHHAVEAAAQRRSLDALVQAITLDRQRERDEFRATVASLAEQLRELDARAEFLSREVRTRDQQLANAQTLAAVELERLRAALASAAAAQVPSPAAPADFSGERADFEARLAHLQARLGETEHDAGAYRRFLNSRAGRVLGRYTRVKRLLGRG